MLRTKVTDNIAPHDTLEVDMPDLEAAQVFSRDSSSEVNVYSVPHMLGSVQVYLDNIVTVMLPIIVL